MPRPLTHIMQDLQLSYVRAVVAQAGATLSQIDGSSDYGTDVTLSAIMDDKGTFTDSGPPVRCQLKASTDCIFYPNAENPTHVKFDMKVDAYNKLVHPKRSYVAFVLFAMPKEQKEWLLISRDCMCLRNCCYWARLLGAKSPNKETKRVCIPISNVFDQAAVNQILEEAAEYRPNG